MNIPSQTLIDVLTFLVPGFVSAAIFHSLTLAYTAFRLSALSKP